VLNIKKADKTKKVDFHGFSDSESNCSISLSSLLLELAGN
jgi:hypothetical protein